MELTREEKVKKVEAFLAIYNHKWGNDWTIEHGEKLDSIYRPGDAGMYGCDGHFAHELLNYCWDFNIILSISCFNERIKFNF